MEGSATKNREHLDRSSSRKQVFAHVSPFVAFMVLLALSGFISKFALDLLEGDGALWLVHAEYWVYPLQCVVCGGLLAYYWKCYRFGPPYWTASVVVGMLVLGLWISPQWLFGQPPRLYGFDPTFFEDSPAMYTLQVGLRFFRLVVIVPLLEEIFWRGFLMRYLINERFTEVPFGAFSWKSFLGVALLFALAHAGPDFTVALLTGLVYNALAVWTRSLLACTLAHAITNLVLGIYIMRTEQWGFW